MTIGEFADLRKETFERLKKAAPDRSVTMSVLLGEIEKLLREQAGTTRVEEEPRARAA